MHTPACPAGWYAAQPLATGLRMFPPILISIPLAPYPDPDRLIDRPGADLNPRQAFQLLITVMPSKVFIDAIPRESWTKLP